MSYRRKIFWAMLSALIAGMGTNAFAQPIFESNTPVGFSSSGRTNTINFITDKAVTVQVDLNQRATAEFPAIANFQSVEASKSFFNTADLAAYMSQAVVVDDNGIIHRAWIQQRGNTVLSSPTSTPAYGVVYAKSLNGGKTFSDTISVSGALRFDMLTTNLAFTGAFSTVDLVVDSKGNPRVVYAMDQSPDGSQIKTASQAYTVAVSKRAYNNIYFNYSNDGGSSWLPANNAVVVNDTTTTNDIAGAGAYPGRRTAFPRMDITLTDDIFIVYERGLHVTRVGKPDIMLAKMDADSLKLGSAQSVQVGSLGNAGSTGGVRIDIDTQIGHGPDIAIGDDDIIHIVWHNTDAGAAAPDAIQHKTMPASQWSDVSGFGWDQSAEGATVGTLSDAATNGGLVTTTALLGDLADLAIAADGIHLFPTVVVDRARTPDRVYAVWKHTDAVTTSTFNDENIAYNFYTYDGQTGTPGAVWGSQLFAFPQGASTATSLYSVNGGALFQEGGRYQIESTWSYVDRVSAVVDDRKVTKGDLHIVFSGGMSLLGAGLSNARHANSLYYSRFNGTEWELPQVVANSLNGTTDGIASQFDNLFNPSISMRSGDDNVYLGFVGGSPSVAGVDIFNNANGENSGRGYGSGMASNIAPLPFFKIIARVVTFDDVSVPTGGFVYRMTHDPVLAQTTFATQEMVVVTVASNTDGSGIGGTTPGSSAAPGGFLTGQWQNVTLNSLGVASYLRDGAGLPTGISVVKGAISDIQGTNDNGVWEGLADDDGSTGFAEWGDDGDKKGLLLKPQVLGSDSSNNLFVIGASSAAQLAGGTPAEPSQSVHLLGYSILGSVTNATPGQSTFVNGITGESVASGLVAGINAPAGSYFQMGANIAIIAANVAPVVIIVVPDAATLSGGGFGNESFGIRYVLFDEDDNVGTTAGATVTDSLETALYVYGDNGLKNVRDIRTFATLIVDENDAFTTATTNPGTGDFVEGSASSNVQDYAWDDPGVTLQGAYGWAPITKHLGGTFFIYIVADDKTNPPVFAVSAGAMRILHIPLVKSVSPVATDTVDTGEFNNLDKTNPFKIKFQLVDFDDNAQVRLFVSTAGNLGIADVTKSGGPFPNLDLTLAGATPIQLSDTLRTDDATEFDFDVTAQGASQDSVIAQGSYFVYAVVADADTCTVGKSVFQLAIRHSPAFEFTAPLVGTIRQLNTTQQFAYTVEWQRGRSDVDVDGNAIISLYYTGVDPATNNFSGTDSTRLIATTGTNPGNAVLIKGNLREDDEGAGDQFVWDFQDPPGVLPRTFRQPFSGAAATNYNVHSYQHGTTTDTAWVYAVLHDSLGNTRVQSGGAVLLIGSQETPASQTPRVIMKTPVSGDQKVVNGDVVRLEWEAFLVDDGTGTDDAYLRLYAAPKGKYSTLTELEGNNIADIGGDVFLINSVTGRDDTPTEIITLRESGSKSFNWDTKTTSFQISGTPTEFDIFIAGSIDPQFGDNVYVNAQLDSIASGVGASAQKAVLSKAPGVMRVEGTDPIFSIELSPGSMTASAGDTLSMDLLANSQGSSIDLMSFYLNVPRNFFYVVDQDAGKAGVQPFADSTAAFQASSTIAQNDTTPGTAQFIHLNFVEASILGEVIGRVASPFDSSQVAGRLQLVVKDFAGGAPLDTVLQWSVASGRQTGFFKGTTQLAQPARDGQIVLTPRARLIVTVPLEGRSDYADTLDAHLREIGSTQDITDQTYIAANDSTPVDLGGGVLGDSVNVVSDAFGTFILKQIPAGIYELTVKAPGYVTGRSDTLTLSNGLTKAITPTFGSDALGDLSPATALNFLRGGDATNDNQVDVADANLIFSIWNKTPADAEFVRDADINDDGVVNSLDLGFVTSNFGNDGFGAPPVFKDAVGGDNATATAELVGIEEVEAWWPGRVFEVTARVEGMNDVMAYGLRLSYDPELVKPLAGEQAVVEGDIFDENVAGSLFFYRLEPGAIDVTAGRIGKDWSASGDAELVTVRFMTLADAPGSIDIVGGMLVNSTYVGLPLRVKKAKALPIVAALHQNYPNPFNPSTEIRFDIPTAREVRLDIYNQLGQTIRTLVDQRMKAGAYTFKWSGADTRGNSVASGVYFFNLEAGDFSQIRKMTLVK